MRQKIASASVWFTILSLSASALNFLYYPILARFLNLSQFGDVQIGVAFIMQAAALFASLNLVALFISAGGKNTDNITTRLERILIVPSIVAASILSILAIPLSNLLQLHDPSLLYLLAVIFILNIPASTWIGTLQGEGKFIKSGWISLVAAAVKIVASVAFVAFGFGAHGAIIGILLGTLVIIPLSYIAQNLKTLSIRETFKLPSREDFSVLSKNRMVTYMLFALFLIAILNTFDVLFAKINLSPENAGVFAQLSILAKIPYFFFVPVSIILFGLFIKKPFPQVQTITLFSLSVIVVSLVVYLSMPLVGPILFNLAMEPSRLLIVLLLIIGFGAFTISSALFYLIIARGGAKNVLVVASISFVIIVSSLILLGKSGEAIGLSFMTGQLITTLLALIVLRYTKKNV